MSDQVDDQVSFSPIDDHEDSYAMDATATATATPAEEKSQDDVSNSVSEDSVGLTRLPMDQYSTEQHDCFASLVALSHIRWLEIGEDINCFLL